MPFKFPKAPHLFDSHHTKRDKHYDQFETDKMLSERLIFQEKLDGYSVSASFTPAGELVLKHLDRPLNTQYANLVRKWFKEREVLLLNYLGDGYVLHGEWLRDCQSVFYNNLPSAFIAFDVYDKKSEIFLCNERLEQLCSIVEVNIAPTLITGVFNLTDVKRMALSNSKFGQEMAEGVYIRYEDEYRVIERAQYVVERASPVKHGKNVIQEQRDA